MLGTVLGAESTALNEIGKTPFFHGASFPLGTESINKLKNMSDEYRFYGENQSRDVLAQSGGCCLIRKSSSKGLFGYRSEGCEGSGTSLECLEDVCWAEWANAKPAF